MVLAFVGLPHRVADSDLYNRHRPYAIRTWERSAALIDDLSYRGKILRINRYGHHDDDFAHTKPDNQLRGLLIGDSITMGQQVETSESFANQLEKLLAEYDPNTRTYQIINTGVQGYNTSQERIVLE